MSNKAELVETGVKPKKPKKPAKPKQPRQPKTKAATSNPDTLPQLEEIDALENILHPTEKYTNCGHPLIRGDPHTTCWSCKDLDGLPQCSYYFRCVECYEHNDLKFWNQLWVNIKKNRQPKHDRQATRIPHYRAVGLIDDDFVFMGQGVIDPPDTTDVTLIDTVAIPIILPHNMRPGGGYDKDDSIPPRLHGLRSKITKLANTIPGKPLRESTPKETPDEVPTPIEMETVSTANTSDVFAATSEMRAHLQISHDLMPSLEAATQAFPDTSLANINPEEIIDQPVNMTIEETSSPDEMLGQQLAKASIVSPTEEERTEPSPMNLTMEKADTQMKPRKVIPSGHQIPQLVKIKTRKQKAPNDPEFSESKKRKSTKRTRSQQRKQTTQPAPSEELFTESSTATSAESAQAKPKKVIRIVDGKKPGWVGFNLIPQADDFQIKLDYFVQAMLEANIAYKVYLPPEPTDQDTPPTIIISDEEMAKIKQAAAELRLPNTQPEIIQAQALPAADNEQEMEQLQPCSQSVVSSASNLSSYGGRNQPICHRQPVRLTDPDLQPTLTDWYEPAAAGRKPIRTFDPRLFGPTSISNPVAPRKVVPKLAHYPYQEVLTHIKQHNLTETIISPINQIEPRTTPGLQCKKLGGTVNLYGVPTTQGIQQFLAEIIKESNKYTPIYNQRKWCTLQDSTELSVNRQPYESNDGILPLTPLSWPDPPHVWMPNQISENTDIPVTEGNMRKFEGQMRTTLRIMSMQDTILEALTNLLRRDEEAQTRYLLYVTAIGDTSEDITRIATEMLWNIIQLRRDAVLYHSTLFYDQARRLRDINILGQTEMFPAAALDSVFDVNLPSHSRTFRQ